MKHLVARFVKDESGATAIEYGLIAALIGVGIITAASALGTQISATFGYIQTELSTASQK
jgi:pilus assembly protein Flp/PilA